VRLRLAILDHHLRHEATVVDATIPIAEEVCFACGPHAGSHDQPGIDRHVTSDIIAAFARNLNFVLGVASRVIDSIKRAPVFPLSAIGARLQNQAPYELVIKIIRPALLSISTTRVRVDSGYRICSAATSGDTQNRPVVDT
jgi:hypothetical protein